MPFIVVKSRSFEGHLVLGLAILGRPERAGRRRPLARRRSGRSMVRAAIRGLPALQPHVSCRFARAHTRRLQSGS